MRSEYGGMTLLWARRMKGDPARWPSARAAMEEIGMPYHSGRRLPPGVVLFYDIGQYGDVGLYIGDMMALRYGEHGPYIDSMHEHPPDAWTLRLRVEHEDAEVEGEEQHRVLLDLLSDHFPLTISGIQTVGCRCDEDGPFGTTEEWADHVAHEIERWLSGNETDTQDERQEGQG